MDTNQLTPYQEECANKFYKALMSLTLEERTHDIETLSSVCDQLGDNNWCVQFIRLALYKAMGYKLTRWI